jgi:LPS sulfotransferase NodH
MRAVFEKPLLFKTNFAGQFMPEFARAFPMPIFVHARRDPWPVARSILQARRRYYGETSVWWSTHSPDYEELSALTPEQQVAGQVASLRRAYAAMIAKVPAELVVEIAYEDLCDDPASFVSRVRERCAEVHGVSVEALHELPRRFERSEAPPPSSDEEVALAEALERALAAC